MYMSDQQRAQIGVCVLFLENIMTKFAQRTKSEAFQPALRHSQKAFLDIIDVGDDKRKRNLVRRMQSGAISLNNKLIAKDTSAVFLALVKSVKKAKDDGGLRIEEGTSAAYLFQKIGENIDNMLGEIVPEDAEEASAIILGHLTDV